MNVEHKTVIDGITYEKGETLPDFGSIEVTENVGGKRKYQGLSNDVSKLPTVARNPKYSGKLQTGSSCLMVDTSDLYLYQGSTDTWYKL